MSETIEKKLELYKKIELQLDPSIDRLKALDGEKNNRKGRIMKTIMINNIIVILAVIIIIPVTVFATSEISHVLYEKVRNVGYSYEKIQKLEDELTKQGFSEEDISNLKELQVNENGQTYGPDNLGADLIEVISEEGDIGYIYRTDLEKSEAKSIDEALGSNGETVLKVYENDGITEIGTFVLSDGN